MTERQSKHRKLNATDDNDASDKVHGVILPVEILEKIFLNVNSADLGECARVCKSWNALFEDDLFWKKLLVANYGGNNLTTPRRGSFQEDFREFSVFENMPNPTWRRTPQFNSEANEITDTLLVKKCVLSHSGKYIAVILEEEETEENITEDGEESTRGSMLKMVSTEPNSDMGERFGCKVLLDYTKKKSDEDKKGESDEEEDPMVRSWGPIDCVEFNASDERILVICNDKSLAPKNHGTAICIFDTASSVLIQRVGLNFTSTSILHGDDIDCNAVWLGENAVIGRLINDDWEPDTLHSSLVVLPVSETVTDSILLQECGGLEQIAVLNNTSEGKRELVCSYSDCTLTMQSIKDFHWCDICETEEPCSNADCMDGPRRIFGLGDNKRETSNINYGTIETMFDDRLFIVDYECITEYDLSLAKVREVQINEVLPWGRLKPYRRQLIDYFCGLFIFRTVGLEEDGKFKVTLWDPDSGSVAHRGTLNYYEQWYFHPKQKLFIVTEKNNFQRLFYAIANIGD